MAIGIDNRLKASSPSPLARPPAAPQKTPQYAPMFKTVGQGAVDKVNNNLLAGAAGTGRMASQQMSGRGISAGRGHSMRADMAQAMASADANRQAQQNNLDVADSNRSARLAYESAMRNEEIANKGLLANLGVAQASADLTRQGYAQDLLEARRRGQLGLDQIYVDKTPLFAGMLQGLLR